MKILIVNTFDIQGGAARAAYRLHRALLDFGIDSQMLVQSKTSDDATVAGRVNKTKIQRVIGLFRPTLDAMPLKFYKNRTDMLFSPMWLPLGGIVNAIEAIDPDVVHLHWICGGMIRIEDLGRIKKPIIWSLHDMWPFTGGCHYDKGCGKYRFGCCSCPVLGSKQMNDLSQNIFTRKQETFKEIDNLTVVGLSSWLADCAKKSLLFSHNQVINLPNPIDTVRFRTVDKVQARMALNLPLSKKLILYGAMSATSDPRKGYTELIKALNMLPKTNDIELVVFGSSQPKNEPKFSFSSHYLGHLNETSLQLLYCAADVMVVPSLQENLSNAIMESLACGTPVVCFNIGGNGDLVLHKYNGYLAEPFSPVDLAKGINWVLCSPDNATLSKNARERVVRCFDSELVAKQYVKLYESVLLR
ncbi:MAG TPA: glycosyl transferase family 1 [Clostridiales bacterium]|nr:glycosyl transferase family 1 [Clostridiales bacterium]